MKKDLFKNKKIEKIDAEQLIAYEDQELTIENCVIDLLKLSERRFRKKVIIKNNVIRQLKLDSASFENGLVLKGNVFHYNFDWMVTGHYQAPIEIEGNVFRDYLSIPYGQFDSLVIVRNNVFMLGTDLLGKKGIGSDNHYNGGIIVENNVGRLDYNSYDTGVIATELLLSLLDQLPLNSKLHISNDINQAFDNGNLLRLHEFECLSTDHNSVFLLTAECITYLKGELSTQNWLLENYFCHYFIEHEGRILLQVFDNYLFSILSTFTIPEKLRDYKYEDTEIAINIEDEIK